MEPQYEEAQQYLKAQYTDIFPPDQIAKHFDQYVQLDLAKQQFGRIRDIANLQAGQSLLDMGSGFGSFVYVSREQGILAHGVDIADYEIQFAQERYEQARLDGDVTQIYRVGDALKTNFPDNSFDVITAWNVLEHVPDSGALLQEASRLLKPNGYFFMVAPNYMAFRQEAHYLVPWLPLLPRPLARIYLRALGRDPSFFNDHIYYVTKLGILRQLKKYDLTVYHHLIDKLDYPDKINIDSTRERVLKIRRMGLKPVVKTMLQMRYMNPLSTAIDLVVRKSA